MGLFLAVTEDLVELNELFNLYWRRVVPLGQTSSIAFPFSRLDREPFWEFVPQPDKTIAPPSRMARPAVIQDIENYEQTQETMALLKILVLGNRQIEE